jgi:hypothetical protein
MMDTNEKEIDDLARQFFDLFTNTDGKIPNVQKIKELFISNGTLINNTTDEPSIYNLESFIEPREAILTNGTLTDFVERETSHTTNIYGNIAQRSCTYKKSGELNGQAFSGEGRKLMQFIKVGERWFLTSVIWSDNEK